LAWLIGSAGIALFHFGAFVQTLRRFKRSQVPASDALLNEVAALARDVGLRRSPRVCMAGEIRTPAVTGLLHPMLLLPVNIQEILSVRELQFVLRHELTHIKRGDLPLNALLCVLLSLHWFNPVLWFLATMPLSAVPVTVPVVVSESEPVPSLRTLMPVAPETEAAAMVRSVP
jgi:beta-lactamase regulating signal transducer with metallopeptidase domain